MGFEGVGVAEPYCDSEGTSFARLLGASSSDGRLLQLTIRTASPRTVRRPRVIVPTVRCIPRIVQCGLPHLRTRLRHLMCGSPPAFLDANHHSSTQWQRRT